MSKLGKKPIHLPKDTTIKVEDGKLILTGPKGSKELNINDKIFSTTVSKENNLILKLLKKNEKSNIMWGTTRSILNNAVIFRTDCESNHGFPDPIKCPNNISRKSLALYYYTNGRPKEEINFSLKKHSTIFKKRYDNKEDEKSFKEFSYLKSKKNKIIKYFFNKIFKK